MNYNTVYERKIRTALCVLLWCSPYICCIISGCDALRKVIPSFFDYFVYIFIAEVLASWIMIAAIEICSRRKKCFSRLRTKQLLKKYSSVAATIVKCRRKPHATSRPGKWIEIIPIVKIDETEIIGNSFADSAPDIGTECTVILFKNKCWIV